MKYIYFGNETPDLPITAIMLIGEHGIVLGHAQNIDLPPLDKVMSGEQFEMRAGRVVVDATSLSSDIDQVVPDLSSYPFTLTIKFGKRADLNIRNCLLCQHDGVNLHTHSRFIEFESARILAQGCR
jgi:hypothetical protein